MIATQAGSQFDPSVVAAYATVPDDAFVAHPRWVRVTRTILVVDDDPMIRKLITTTLEDVAGFRLREAGDGRRPSRPRSRSSPEIVFLDYDMPRLDGIETCRRLRSDPVTADATIVMLTGMSDTPAQDRAAAAGADLFLTKPFSPLRLLRLVDDIGNRRPLTPGAPRSRRPGRRRTRATPRAGPRARAAPAASPADARLARANSSHERAKESRLVRPPERCAASIGQIPPRLSV